MAPANVRYCCAHKDAALVPLIKGQGFYCGYKGCTAIAKEEGGRCDKCHQLEQGAAVVARGDSPTTGEASNGPPPTATAAVCTNCRSNPAENNDMFCEGCNKELEKGLGLDTDEEEQHGAGAGEVPPPPENNKEEQKDGAGAGEVPPPLENNKEEQKDGAGAGEVPPPLENNKEEQKDGAGAGEVPPAPEEEKEDVVARGDSPSTPEVSGEPLADGAGGAPPVEPAPKCYKLECKNPAQEGKVLQALLCPGLSP
jgi:hypothetical protein